MCACARVRVCVCACTCACARVLLHNLVLLTSVCHISKQVVCHLFKYYLFVKVPMFVIYVKTNLNYFDSAENIDALVARKEMANVKYIPCLAAIGCRRLNS